MHTHSLTPTDERRERPFHTHLNGLPERPDFAVRRRTGRLLVRTAAHCADAGAGSGDDGGRCWPMELLLPDNWCRSWRLCGRLTASRRLRRYADVG